MLQQTQVQTVIPYWEAFLERFPTVEALAGAPIDEVLAAWTGLGYYRRARQLHRAAGEVVERGGLPENAEGLEELPGIGPYTAAAVASIAFGEVVAGVDGNVERVISRVLALEEDPKRSAGRKEIAATAARLLDPRRPGDGNQALMELGATVCRPRAPRCGECPLEGICRAAAEGEPERYPPPRNRREVERVELAVALVEERRRVLLFRRPRGSELLAGMWELPNVVGRRGKKAMEAELAARYGGRFHLGARRGEVRHGITFRALEIRVFEARFEAGESVAEGPEAAWVGPEEMAAYATSSAVLKILKNYGPRPAAG